MRLVVRDASNPRSLWRGHPGASHEGGVWEAETVSVTTPSDDAVGELDQ
jgi:hypothetical protein